MATNWNAEGVDFGNFFPVQASYGPRDIFAEAALVTKNNVGQWALEFEMDVKNNGGAHYFDIFATREDDNPIKLTIKPGVWIVKVWGELHVFDDGLFQNTFDVSKDQMQVCRKAHREREIELEREWKREQEEVRTALEADFEAKLDKALETGNWDDLDIPERQVLMRRLRDDEQFKVFQAAAQLMMDAKKRALQQYAAKDAEVSQHLHIPIANLVEEIQKSGVGPDYHAGSLYKPEGQDPKIYESPLTTAMKSLDGETVERVDEETKISPAVGELGPNAQKVEERRRLWGKGVPLGTWEGTEDGNGVTFHQTGVGELDTDEANGRIE